MAPPDPVATEADPRTGTETPPEEVHAVLSDMHLSEGKTVRVREKLTLFARVWRIVLRLFRRAVPPPRLVEIDNPLEDFPDDSVFESFVETLVSKYGQARNLCLELMGDVFDPLAVPWAGRFIDPPFEAVAKRKMRRIIRGHPLFFDTLAAFIRRPNCSLRIFAGNHDLFLVWPAVRREIVARIAGDDLDLARKIGFVGHEEGFKVVHRGVIYDHGNNAEASNTVDPKDAIIRERFGIALKKPVLNHPLGSYLAAGIVNKIKLRNPLVGRLVKPGDIWKNAVLHKWGWGVYVGLVLFWNFLYNQFFAFWHVRRKTSVAQTLKIVLSTISDDSVDRYARKLLKENPGCRVVVLGHSHEWRRVSDTDGTYLNTGTWSLMYDLVEPKIDLRWKRFRWAEVVLRSLQHFFRTREIPFATQLTKFIGFIALVLAMTTFVFSSLKDDLRILSFHVTDFQVPVAILLVFVVVSGAVRFLAVKPTVVPSWKLTFGLIRYYEDGNLQADLMEYKAAERAIRECV